MDIPPTVFAAAYYLKGVLGDANVGAYDALREARELPIGEMRKRWKTVVLCPWQLPQLSGNVDLFVNFISFQEMEPAVVENYLGHVDRLSARLVLLRNLREGKQTVQAPGAIGVQEPILGGDYDKFLPNYRLVATNTEPFGFKTSDGFHSELRIYERR